MIIGNYMLLNLFLAILLKFISENSESDQKPEEEKKMEDTVKIKDKESNADKKSQSKKDPDHHDSGVMNSSNSNIEEEFEQIK